MSMYLLDTHIFLWALADDCRLDKQIKDLLNKKSDNVIVSCVSIWEIMIKKSIKKLNAPDNLTELLFENNIKNLSVTLDHVLYLEKLPNIHKDPFDRLLLAQCLSEDLTFITADQALRKYGIRCLDF